ncbi:hypothetical protein [Hymenobacter jeongseonensis]|nr:hypothetical protein [Hymenobacter jeongseonensis]
MRNYQPLKIGGDFVLPGQFFLGMGVVGISSMRYGIWILQTERE